MSIRIKLTKEQLTILIAATAGFALISIYLLIYAPLLTKVSKALRECKTCESDVMKAHSKIQHIERSAYKSRLLSEVEISGAINELTKQEKVKGIDIKSITPKGVTLEGPHKVMPLKLEMESTYEDIGQFLGILDGFTKSVITVKSFHIVPDKINPARFLTNMIIYIYLKK